MCATGACALCERGDGAPHAVGGGQAIGGKVGDVQGIVTFRHEAVGFHRHVALDISPSWAEASSRVDGTAKEVVNEARDSGCSQGLDRSAGQT